MRKIGVSSSTTGKFVIYSVNYLVGIKGKDNERLNVYLRKRKVHKRYL